MADEKEETKPQFKTPAPPPTAAPNQKQFDVALVDPVDPRIEHWPRVRVTVDAASLDNLTAVQKQPPPGGESADAEQKRLAFLVGEIERGRAIGVYGRMFGIVNSHLRYDVVPTTGADGAPVVPDRWLEYLKNLGRR